MDPILHVLVLYNQNLEDTVAFQTLDMATRNSGRKSQLFVYDNSRVPQTIPHKDHWIIAYVHDPTNPGVSRAYNQAAVYAKQHRMKWLLLLDQDTSFPDCVDIAYESALNRYKDCSVFVPTLIDKRGIVSPFKPGITSGTRIKKSIVGKMLLREIQAINSGLLMSLDLFEAAGGYDERIRLDFSDFIFFKKLKKQTKYIVVIDAIGRHGHSSSEKTSLGSALQRFKIYLEGSRRMGYEGNADFIFLLRAFAHTIKLSFQYRSARFIRFWFFRSL